MLEIYLIHEVTDPNIFVAVKSNLELKEFDRPIDTKIMPYYEFLIK